MRCTSGVSGSDGVATVTREGAGSHEVAAWDVPATRAPRGGPHQLPGLLPVGKRVALQDHFGGRAPVGCTLRGNRRVSGWLPEAVVCFGGPPVVVAGNS